MYKGSLLFYINSLWSIVKENYIQDSKLYRSLFLVWLGLLYLLFPHFLFQTIAKCCQNVNLECVLCFLELYGFIFGLQNDTDMTGLKCPLDCRHDSFESITLCVFIVMVDRVQMSTWQWEWFCLKHHRLCFYHGDANC